MTFPTAEELEVYGHDGDTWFTVEIKQELRKEQAESLKQQIISEHEIVERLKKRINKLPRIAGHIHESLVFFGRCDNCKEEKQRDIIENSILDTLKSILENKK